MKHIVRCFLLALLLAVLAVVPAGAESPLLVNGDWDPKTADEVGEMVSQAARDYYEDGDLAAELRAEISFSSELGADGSVWEYYTLTHNGRAMRFIMEQLGEPGAGGYPLYLTLHGGGESSSEENDAAWADMFFYYKDFLQDGVYVACRGITDTWDLHFRPDSYPLYDRLIQALICLYHVDPNRVYLLGYSAGGDGVYQITPRMADRFAAANMSAGHPNGVSLLNLANVPFSIQVGVRDYYTEEAMRCVRGAEFERVLNEYHDWLDYGYEHQVLVHIPRGHYLVDYIDTDLIEDLYPEDAKMYRPPEILVDPSVYADPGITGKMLNRFLDVYKQFTGDDSAMGLSYYDEEEDLAFGQMIREVVINEFGLETKRVNCSAVAYVNRFVRDPAPPTVVWDLSTRASSREVTSFYWLRADPSVTRGMIQARADKETNTIVLLPVDVDGDFSVLIHPGVVDVSLPIHFILPKKEVNVQVNPSGDVLRDSMLETGDPSLAWVAEIPYSLLIGDE